MGKGPADVWPKSINVSPEKPRCWFESVVVGMFWGCFTVSVHRRRLLYSSAQQRLAENNVGPSGRKLKRALDIRQTWAKPDDIGGTG